MSCSKDKLPEMQNNCTEEVTYQQIKPIIGNSCAYTGCHVSGFAFGSHLSYVTLEPQLDNGLFHKKVIAERSMPPSNAPSGRPKSLTIEEITLLACWAESGYPEQ